MALRGVIFDCDGVMIDSTDANRQFYNLILEHYGLPHMRPEQERYCFMATSAQALESLLPRELHPLIPRMGREVVNYRHKIMPLVKIYPGFLDFVQVLHNHGIRMAVLTNRTEGGIKAVLDFFALPPYFNPVVSASGARPKPDPEGAFRILEAWKCPAHDVLYIGDSATDQKTARAAGIPFVAFNPAQPLDADMTVSSWAELRERLQPELATSQPASSQDAP